MRTPWRFIADLVSRKPENRNVEPVAPELKEIEFHPVAGAGKAEVEASEGTIKVDDPMKVEPSETTVAAPSPPTLEPIKPIVKPAEIHEHPPVAESATDSPHKDASLTKTEKKPARMVRGERPQGSNTVEQAETAKTFLDEIAELEKEIEQLRRQLAGKLLKQNAQLKRLLERYRGD